MPRLKTGIRKRVSNGPGVGRWPAHEYRKRLKLMVPALLCVYSWPFLAIESALLAYSIAYQVDTRKFVFHALLAAGWLGVVYAASLILFALVIMIAPEAVPISEFDLSKWWGGPHLYLARQAKKLFRFFSKAASS